MALSILEGYVRREELAAELQKSVRTLDRWDVRRVGPPRTIVGRLILYNVDSVREWLSSQEVRQPKTGRRLAAQR